MKKRGFTLIELLAVIVILAIIALIATPIVMNVIEKSRQKSAEASMDQIERAAELYFYNSKVQGEFLQTTFTCTNGTCKSGDKFLEISGKGPESGTIIINQNGEVSMSSMVIDGYICVKSDKGYSCTKGKSKDVFTTNGVITLKDVDYTLLNDYKIYGNSVESKFSDEYQEVEYIESKVSSQYIDTGFIPTINTTIESKLAQVGPGGTYSAFYGTQNSDNGQHAFILFDDENQTFGARVGKTGKITTDVNIENNVIYTTKLSYNKLTINGVSYQGNLEWGDNLTNTLYIFARNGLNLTAGRIDARLYYMKIYEGNTLVRNFVPCYRIEDNEIGLYDLVENKFYPNQGAGDFLAGPDVSTINTHIEVNNVGDLVVDQNDPNYGKYVISVKASGKNLYLCDNSVLVSHNANWHIRSYQLKPNTTYTASLKNCDMSSWTKQQKEYVCGVSGLSGLNGVVNYVQIYEDKTTTFTTDETGLIKIRYSPSLSGKLPVGPQYITQEYKDFMDSCLQIEEGDTVTDYEPYQELTTNIYLDEPLTTNDYIDYKNQELSKNGVITKLELPSMQLFKGYNNIIVDTNVTPSNMTVNYYSSLK